MLIACPSCHRQYDAGSHDPGTKVRCLCGVAIVVPEQRARDIRMLHCSACGAGLPEGATQCDYCGAGVALSDKGLGDVCPECMTRMVAGAGFSQDQAPTLEILSLEQVGEEIFLHVRLHYK